MPGTEELALPRPVGHSPWSRAQCLGLGGSLAVPPYGRRLGLLRLGRCRAGRLNAAGQALELGHALLRLGQTICQLLLALGSTRPVLSIALGLGLLLCLPLGRANL